MARRIYLSIGAALLVAGCGVPASQPAQPVAQQQPSTTAERISPTTTAPPAPTTPAAPAAPAAPEDSTTLTSVASITDGDTFRTVDGTRIRIIGVDTPERGDCYFTEASAHLEELIPPGTSIRLEHDVERTDRNGRTLAYVYRADDDLFVNLAMAADGFAQQMTIPPNVAHAEDFRVAVAEARDAQRGLWSGCAGPVATTAPPPPTAAPPPPPPPAPAAAPTSGACHSSYEGTCIPPDVEDADCAGGSGNGPHYVQEKNVRVVGPDVFGLDSDNDGLGCES